MNRKQMNRASGTCETKTKDPMFISPGSQENKEMGWKSIQKDMAENSPNVVKDTNLQIQEAGQASNK